MKDKLQSEYFKLFSTALFAGLSYFIADFFQISTLIFNFSDEKWHVTVSVAIYTAFLQGWLLFFLSKRTTIQVDIVEKKDKSSKISLEDSKPRVVEVKISVKGNLKKMTKNVEINFPKWVDVMTKASPDMKQKLGNPNIYVVNLSGITQAGINEISLFTFDITMNPIYEGTGRSGEVLANISGNRFRYAKNAKGLTIHYRI